MGLASFTRSFLDLIRKKNPSNAFIHRAFAAARKRHPNGYIERDRHSVKYMVPDIPGATGPLCLLILSIR